MLSSIERKLDKVDPNGIQYRLKKKLEVFQEDHDEIRSIPIPDSDWLISAVINI